MSKINILIHPEETGGGTYYDPPNPLIVHALEDFGYTKISIDGNNWRGLKWGFIPVGGEIPWDTRVILRECMERKQKAPIRITVEANWFPNGV